MLAAGPTVVTFRVDPQEILRAMPTVRVRFVPPPDADVGPKLVAAATWLSAGGSKLVAVRAGSCEIPRAAPGEGVLVTSGVCALTMTRIDIQGSADISLDLPLARRYPVSGRVEVPAMTDPSCEVRTLPLDGGLPPPPLGFAVNAAIDADGRFDFRSGPRGRQVILVTKHGFGIGWLVADNTNGSVTGLRIPLREGVGITLRPTEGAVPPEVQVETEDGIPLFANVLVLNPKHRLSTLTLAEGRYMLRYRVFPGGWQARPLTVGKAPVVVGIP
jgi:hypothetical protein